MLLSMTGHGQAQNCSHGAQAWAEIRAVNNRYLKVTVSYPDRAAELETNVKAVVQKHIRRGSVHVNLELQRDRAESSLQIDTALLQSLYQQLKKVDPNASIDGLLALPGVVQEARRERSGPRTTPNSAGASQSDWDLLKPAVEEAMVRLVEMRTKEGAAAAKDLLENRDDISHHLGLIRDRAPGVAREYAGRLTERINQMLAEHEVSISPSDVVKEVGVFADRCDISEEVVRLQTHIDQFSELIKSGQSDGRKLEFLSQEMLRETNTIGSKANDSSIAQSVVEIKTALDRIREMTQNVE